MYGFCLVNANKKSKKVAYPAESSRATRRAAIITDLLNKQLRICRVSGGTGSVDTIRTNFQPQRRFRLAAHRVLEAVGTGLEVQHSGKLFPWNHQVIGN